MKTCHAAAHPVMTHARRAHARLHATRWLAVLLLAVLPLLPRQTHAENSCWIRNTSSIAFGNVTGGGGTSSGTIDIACQNDGASMRSYRVCLYLDPDNPTGVAPRRMILWYPESFLRYDLYADPAGTRLIGSQTSGHPVFSTTLTMGSSGQGSGAVPLHARVPPGQILPAGNYSGGINVVVRMASQAGNVAPPETQCSTSPQGGGGYIAVSARYENACFISIATDLDFGSTGDLSSPHLGTSTLQLYCPAGTPWHVGLDNGSHASGNVRRMAGPSGHVTYDLYQDTARTQRWGNAVGTDTRSGTGMGTLQSLTVHGRVPVQPNPGAGAYSDTVTVTLTY